MPDTQDKVSLTEDHFIHEGIKKNPGPLWIFAGLVLVVLLGLFISQQYFSIVSEKRFENRPFLQVTNREMSLFFWQNPAFMRANAKRKSGLLPGFHSEDSIQLRMASVDDYVIAPPSFLFYYHAWHRLLYLDPPARRILGKEFMEFLTYSQEWHPIYWNDAPAVYVELLDRLEKDKSLLIQEIDRQQIPKEVQLAFQGWKNFFHEGEAINSRVFTFAELEAFLEKNPTFNRNFWRNILIESVPDYLFTFSKKDFRRSEKVPFREMSAFLRLAMFNFLEAQEGK